MPKFNELYGKLKRNIELSGKSKSTLTNYGRCLATMALHFGCSPLELDEEQVLDYLHYLKTQSKTPSSSYFKHTVYGLSFAYKVMGIDRKGISLPSLKFPKKLPVVLSKNEVRLLLKTPQLLKHRIVLAMLYGCGLRRFELLNIKLQDVDLDRKMLHVREGKGRKDTYATHLLEMGLDIMTLKDLLGHSDIKTTLVYLHIAQLGRGRAFNPIDKLYPDKGSAK